MSIKTRQVIASQNHRYQGVYSVWTLHVSRTKVHLIIFSVPFCSCSILAVTFFPDGNTFACAGGDSTIRVWSAHSLKEILTLKGHRWNEWSLNNVVSIIVHTIQIGNICTHVDPNRALIGVVKYWLNLNLPTAIWCDPYVVRQMVRH